jgi:hypothetical protein
MVAAKLMIFKTYLLYVYQLSLIRKFTYKAGEREMYDPYFEGINT